MFVETLKDELTQFLNWWLHGKPIIPVADGVYFLDNLVALVLYREGPFQVELVVSGRDIPVHTHPEVDSYEVLLTGEVTFHLEDKVYRNVYGVPIRVKEGAVHSGTFGKAGGAFLSIQHWLSGIPSTVGLDWEGSALGEKHEAFLSQSEKNYG